MDMPNLPTDNLYKFIALSGVLIFITIIVLMYSTMSNLSDETTKLETEVGELNFGILLSERKMDLIKNELKQLDKETTKKYRINKTLKDTADFYKFLDSFHNPEQREYYQFIVTYRDNIAPELKRFEKLFERQEELDKLNDDIYLKNYQVKRKNEILKQKLNFIKWTSILWIFGLLSSAFMSSIGFTFWYTRVQFYLDVKLKAETKLLVD
jgi:hypothetical protein